MAYIVSAQAVAGFRARIEELLVVVDERLELDMRFECAGPECGRPEPLVRPAAPGLLRV
jgi:hypothetical protein